jgi:glutathione S-transferase
MHLFEIMQYLEDRFGSQSSPSLLMDTPDDRAFVHLLVQCHDIYISSPNCTQNNFSHTQGCMYLDPVPSQFTPARRTMKDVGIRAAKLAEIFKQLLWLESQVRLPYMAGDRITHADLTWFPTAVFMELLLPFCFGWSRIFYETDQFPKLSVWFQHCLVGGGGEEENNHFAKTRLEIYDTLVSQKRKGRFLLVKEQAETHPEFKWKYM